MKKIIDIFRKKPAPLAWEDEFRNLIRSFPQPIKSDSREYSHADLIMRFERILTGEFPVDYMTRTHGLREKLEKLLTEKSL